MLNVKQLWWHLTHFLQKDEEVELYRDKFAGSQAQRIVRAEAEAEKLAAQLKKTNVSGLLNFSHFSFTSWIWRDVKLLEFEKNIMLFSFYKP